MGRPLAVLLTAAVALAGCGGSETEEVSSAPVVNGASSAKTGGGRDGSVLRYEMLRLNGTRENLAR